MSFGKVCPAFPKHVRPSIRAMARESSAIGPKTGPMSSMEHTPPTLVWFRRDLRLHDHPALHAALARGGPVYPVFIWAPEEEQPWAPGAASRWWLHHSLAALAAALRREGLRLTVRRGPSLAAMQALVRETGATAVYWNRLYEPAVLARDRAAKTALRAQGLEARSFNAHLLYEPWTVLTQARKPYQVFTPFHRACQALGEPSRPATGPNVRPPATKPLDTLPLEVLHLLPTRAWDAGLRATWTPGEAGALARLRTFSAPTYADERDRPDREGTSRLSPHLHFGEISPRHLWWTLRGARGNADAYLRQLIWREFAHHLLYHFPHTPEMPLRDRFAAFPWCADAHLLKRWRKGLTGYPIVDAGMRELWTTGWMHNRVRMIVGSFLVKDLLISWREGAAWFWDTLVDADLANNTLGWQWVAGCGADAAPFFRIFNPALQGAKFDPDGRYVRRWVPELGARAAAVLPAYPAPVVDHAVAREQALLAYGACAPQPSATRKGLTRR